MNDERSEAARRALDLAAAKIESLGEADGLVSRRAVVEYLRNRVGAILDFHFAGSGLSDLLEEEDRP